MRDLGRQIAGAVGITERAALSILRALEADGIVERTKEGRRNRYWVNMDALFRFTFPGQFSLEELISVLSVLAARVSSEAATRQLGDAGSSDGPVAGGADDDGRSLGSL